MAVRISSPVPGAWWYVTLVFQNPLPLKIMSGYSNGLKMFAQGING